MQDSATFLEKSGSRFCLSPDKDASTTFGDTLQKAALAAVAHKGPFHSGGGRNTLSTQMPSLQARNGRTQTGSVIPGAPQPDVPQVGGASKKRQWREAASWAKPAQLRSDFIKGHSREGIGFHISHFHSRFSRQKHGTLAGTWGLQLWGRKLSLDPFSRRWHRDTRRPNYRCRVDTWPPNQIHWHKGGVWHAAMGARIEPRVS